MMGGLMCRKCGAPTCTGPECSLCWMKKVAGHLTVPELPERPTIKDLARRAAEVNAANGWEPCKWDNVLAKIACVGTEVRELQRGMAAGDSANIAEECADIAIRLLSMLEECWPGWASRVEHRRRQGTNMFATPAELVKHHGKATGLG